jgi:hypothetical protein
MFDVSEVHKNERMRWWYIQYKINVWIDWINGMIWLGYFMAGIMWH